MAWQGYPYELVLVAGGELPVARKSRPEVTQQLKLTTLNDRLGLSPRFLTFFLQFQIGVKTGFGTTLAPASTVVLGPALLIPSPTGTPVWNVFAVPFTLNSAIDRLYRLRWPMIA